MITNVGRAQHKVKYYITLVRLVTMISQSVDTHYTVRILQCRLYKLKLTEENNFKTVLLSHATSGLEVRLGRELKLSRLLKPCH